MVRACCAQRLVPLSHASSKLPERGERFEGTMPPVVAAPGFAIRKPAVAVFTLDDYVATGVMTSKQAIALKRAVEARKKHTRGRRYLQRQDDADQRTASRGRQDIGSRCSHRRHQRASVQGTNLVALRTKDGVISLSDLVRSSLRLRPDRIPIG